MQFPAGRKLHFFFKPCHPKTSPPSTVVIQGSLCSCSGYATSCDSFCSWVMCEGQFNRWGTLQPLKKHTSLVGPFIARGEWPFAKEWAVATSSLFAQVIGIISIKRACWVEWHSVISYPAVKINDNVHSAWLSPHCTQEACPDKADIILFFLFSMNDHSKAVRASYQSNQLCRQSMKHLSEILPSLFHRYCQRLAKSIVC